MASDGKQGGANSATAQFAKTMQAVTAALQSASQKAVAGNNELARRVMTQTEENMTQLLKTLEAAASSKSPTEVAGLYTRFLAESAQKHTKQLMEVGQLVAQASQQSWAPVAEAIMSASKRGTTPNG